ncbi:MAG: efflux RND transporter permease subunit [Candidatus Aminicenantes bacterium]|nr:efflux RND transporter permease subunit [Candidatus Aminicenantes bacterium]
MRLAKVAIDRPVATAMVFAAVILLGFVSLRELSVDLLPDIRYPRLSVITRYPGVAPEEIETLITARLEAAVSRVPGLRRVESVSKEGVSTMTLEFNWGTDMDFTLLHTREKLDAVRDALPDDAEDPTIITLDPQSRPIIVLAISGDRSLLELKEFAEELVKPRLEQVEGIGSAETTGGVEREIQVELNPELLSLYGLTVQEVAARIDAFNRNLQGGTVRKGMFKYAMRVVGEFEAVDEIGEISLKVTADKGVVRLKDIARVKDAVKERQGMTRLDGKESIGLLVRKEYGANTVKVTKLARQAIDQMRREYPGVTIEVVSEQSRYIETAIGAVRDEIIQGAILAFLVLLIFLQEWKTPLIIDTVIPISIIGTFSLLYYSNITLNIMSLGGLALGVGMLDDCAVVVSENIFRHRSLGKSLSEAAYIGTKEVGGAVIAAALNTVVVFFPVVYVHGVAGELFKDTALTVTFSLLASLVVALTLLPMLASRTFKLEALKHDVSEAGRDTDKAAAGKKAKLGFLLLPYQGLRWLVGMILKGVAAVLRFLWTFISQLLAFVFHLLGLPVRPVLRVVFQVFNRAYGKFVSDYERLLRWSLDNKAKVMVTVTLFFAATFILGTQIRSELMPRMKTNSFELQLKTPVDYSLEQTAEIVDSLEQFLASQKTVRKTLSQTGIVSGLEAMNPDVSLNSARIFVAVEKPAQVEETLDALRARLGNFPDVAYSITREQSAMTDLLGLSAAEVGLRVKGDDLERLSTIAEDLVRGLQGVAGIADLNTNIGEGKPEFLVRIRRDALQKYANLSPAAIGNFLVSAVRGRVATQFNELEKKYDILVRLEEADKRTIEALLDEPFPHQSTLIPLRELVTYSVVRGPKEIRREGQQREVLITARLRGAKMSQVMPAIDRVVREADLPPDYRVVFGGEREEMTRSFRSLLLALILATVLTYMIMAAQFESLLHPFLILITLPMGAAGCVVFMLLTGQTINIISVIGMIVLVGLVVDNATVKIDYTNQLRRGGMGLREAVLEGSHVRLRPILMSTLSTLFGLVPMALGLEAGAELMKPLAIVVIGGLTFSTFLTLVVIPVVYEWVERKR